MQTQEQREGNRDQLYRRRNRLYIGPLWSESFRQLIDIDLGVSASVCGARKIRNDPQLISNLSHVVS